LLELAATTNGQAYCLIIHPFINTPKRLQVMNKIRHCFKVVILRVTLIHVWFFAAICVYAKEAHGQLILEKEITVNVKNESIRSVLSKLEHVSDAKFVYSPEVIEASQKVNLVATKKSLKLILAELLAPLNLDYELKNEQYIILSRKSKEQSNKHVSFNSPQAAYNYSPPDSMVIRGVVTDAQGNAMEGVSVTVKNSSNVTVSDKDGRYTIKVRDNNSVLVFTYVGYSSLEKEVNGVRVVNATLTAGASSLEDVVVVGYGTQKKATVTGAINTVSGKEILKSPTSNVTNSLVGKMPGLTSIQRSGQPGRNSADLLIRGQATYGDASPIVIIDGIERESFGDIDPNEIENISILKDASSTAIFGIRGANGVIIVTTRSGKEGKPRISYSGNVSMQSYTGIPKSLDAYNTVNLLNEAYVNDGSAPLFTPAEVQKFKDGSDPYGYPDVNWFDYLTRKSYAQTQHNVSVSGGTKMIKYFASVGYLFEDGIFKKFESPYGFSTTPSYTRYNFRSNLDMNLTKDLQVTVRLGGRLQNRYQPAGAAGSSFSYDNLEGMISRILQTPSYAYPVMLADGKIAQNPAVGTNVWNPYAVITRWGTREDDYNTIESNININYKLDAITKGLSFKGVFAYDSYFTSVARRNALWAAYVYDRATGNITLSPDRQRNEPLGGYNASSSGNINSNMQLGFNYNRSFGKHNVSSVLLATRQLIQREGSDLNAAPSAMQGIINRTSYNFSEKYFVEFDAAYNGSENFAPGLQYGFFPSASAGWTISKEKFVENLKWLSYLKIRGSYGLVGNDNVGGRRFYFLTDYAVTNGGVSFGLPTSIVSSPIVNISLNGNPQVTWETGTKRNIGFESRFFKNSLTLNVDLFDETRKNILTSRSVNSGSGMATYGLTYPAVNVGEVYNKGYEIELNYNGKAGAVNYAINSNLNFNRNKIINMDEASGTPEYMMQKNKRIGQYFGYITNGFYTSAADIASSTPNSLNNSLVPGDLKYVDYNKDGVISSDDRAPIGYSRFPEYNFALSPSLTYKGLSLSVMFQGVANVSSDVILTEQNNGQQMYEFMLDRWTPATAATATWPALHSRGKGYNYLLNDFILQDASYIKLRNAELSWNLPKRWVAPFNLSSVRIYLNGQNLHTWTKFKMYLDPEAINTSNTDFSKQSIYPTSRIYNFGVNVQL
jgi:TonB-linked SusC/RagA family outer membrane protein